LATNSSSLPSFFFLSSPLSFCAWFILKGLIGSMVAVAFQIAFRAKMHANDVFLFFKNHF
jgi:hypothetical protein